MKFFVVGAAAGMVWFGRDCCIYVGSCGSSGVDSGVRSGVVAVVQIDCSGVDS